VGALREDRTVHEARELWRALEARLRALVADSMHEARAEWAERTEALFGGSAGSFKLDRFTAFTAAALRALDVVAAAAFARAAHECDALVSSSFAAGGEPWLRWEVREDGGCLRVAIRADAQRAADMLVRAHALALPELAELRAACAVLALDGEAEMCATERSEQERTRARALLAAAELSWGVGGPGEHDVLNAGSETHWEALRRVALVVTRSSGGAGGDQNSWAALRLRSVMRPWWRMKCSGAGEVDAKAADEVETQRSTKQCLVLAGLNLTAEAVRVLGKCLQANALLNELHHLPQLQTLVLGCALATAEPARDGWRGGAAPSSHACVRVWGCDGDGDRDCAGAGVGAVGDGSSDGASGVVSATVSA
jgi:hypothetical protein